MRNDKSVDVMVYVDSYENEIPQGRFCVTGNGTAKTFHSLTQLLIKLKKELEDTQNSQGSDKIRRFHDLRKQPFEMECDHPVGRGRQATLAVRILFRQNASWQGSVRWAEGGQEESFRSVLELIMLIDNALSYSKMNRNSAGA